MDDVAVEGLGSGGVTILTVTARADSMRLRRENPGRIPGRGTLDKKKIRHCLMRSCV